MPSPKNIEVNKYANLPPTAEKAALPMLSIAVIAGFLWIIGKQRESEKHNNQITKTGKRKTLSFLP